MFLTAKQRIAEFVSGFYLPLLLLLATPFALPFDLPLAGWIAGHRLAGDLNEVFVVAESFGHGVGVAFILLAVGVLGPSKWRITPRLLSASVGSGLAADVVKLLIWRQRPRAFEFATDNVWDTFGPALPLLQAGSEGQSFPSAHSATAVGLAAGLATCFPHGRWMFAILAMLTCLSRMHVSAHFLSDVLAGAAIGLVVARFVMRPVAQNRLHLTIPDSRPPIHIQPSGIRAA